ncbi:MAG TPA: putative selenium-dependent hydroxylase accessory protein YqeC, partial [Syntrophorhabdus aromaticivorans]|nr:putative selenium-dependent hydroxylase accessory protein YqeC [Syntrophorhabdus aromaticivorans]
MSQCLDLRERELISITGAGGKSSLAFSLCESGGRGGKRALFTTTTHVGRNQIPSYMKVVSGPFECIDKTIPHAFRQSFCVGVFSGTSEEKLTGFGAEEVDRFYQSGVADFVIVEADGAKGFPVKGYEAHEPVIPDKTTCHIVVVGAELFCMPLNEE